VFSLTRREISDLIDAMYARKSGEQKVTVNFTKEQEELIAKKRQERFNGR
jgi:hypothetical protein